DCLTSVKAFESSSKQISFLPPCAVGASRSKRHAYGTLTGFESSDTAPLRARARPLRVAPFVKVMEVSATMFPLKVEDVPSVAELPTCQNTFLACVPPLRITCELVAVVSEDPTWKMKTAFASPSPF